MLDVPLRDVVDASRLLTAPGSSWVRDACRMMATAQVGAVLVVDDGALRGIFTERDAVFRVMAAGLDPDATPISRVMTQAPMTLSADKPLGTALALMQKHGFRHVPVIDAGRLLGVVSARKALDPELEEFVAEARRRDRYLALASPG